MDVPNEDYGSFHLIDTGLPHPGAIALSIRRSASISEVFRTIFPPNLVGMVMDLQRQDYGPSIFLKPNTKRKEFSAEDIYSYYGIRAHIQAKQYHYEKGMGRRPFVGLWREEIVPFFSDKEGLISRLSYERLNARFWLPNSFVRDILSSHLASIVAGGELRALGEIMYKWRGKSPCIQEIRSKPEPVGHWTSQLCVRMEASGLPVCIGMYPFDRCTTLGEKQSVCDVFMWASKLHNPALGRSILCADSYYLDNSSRPQLMEAEQPFLCSIKNDRFNVLTDCLQEKVKQPGEWYGLHNTSTREVMIHHYAKDGNVQRKTLLTNALVCNRSEKQSPFRPPGWIEYKSGFSMCNEFNCLIKDRSYPFRRSQWQHNFDDLFVTSLLLNACNIWLSLNYDERKSLTYSACFDMLALELVQ